MRIYVNMERLKPFFYDTWYPLVKHSLFLHRLTGFISHSFIRYIFDVFDIWLRLFVWSFSLTSVVLFKTPFPRHLICFIYHIYFCNLYLITLRCIHQFSNLGRYIHIYSYVGFYYFYISFFKICVCGFFLSLIYKFIRVLHIKSLNYGFFF